MCTLILLHRCVDGAPLVVAANRDEYLDRPAAPPALLTGDGPAVAAPRDLRAGGTWLGLNAVGLFAALTNRPTRDADRSRRSRGLLVLDALRQPSAASAADRLESLPAGGYNPFNLVLADREQAFALSYDDAPRVKPLAPGAHVVGNADPFGPEVPKLAWLRVRAAAASRAAAGSVLERLGDLCRGHGGPGGPLDDACVHLPGYGTRSSTLVRLDDGPGRGAFHFADGPPCRTQYDDYTHLLDALDRRVDASPGPRVARSAN